MLIERAVIEAVKQCSKFVECRNEVSVLRRSRDASFGTSRSRANLVRSRSRSRLEPKTEDLGLGPQRLVLRARFQRQKFT